MEKKTWNKWRGMEPSLLSLGANQKEWENVIYAKKVLVNEGKGS